MNEYEKRQELWAKVKSMPQYPTISDAMFCYMFGFLQNKDNAESNHFFTSLQHLVDTFDKKEGK